jgi:chromosome segregation ATPase
MARATVDFGIDLGTTNSVQTRSYTQAQLDSLNSRITSGRNEIAALENQIRTIDAELNTTKTAIDSYKATIGQYEQYTRSGYNVDQYQYQLVLQNHNALVSSYNARLQQRQEAYLTYKQWIDQDQALVQQYNSLANHR